MRSNHGSPVPALAPVARPRLVRVSREEAQAILREMHTLRVARLVARVAVAR